MYHLELTPKSYELNSITYFHYIEEVKYILKHHEITVHFRLSCGALIFWQ
jgi:hypothetical protein